MRRQQLRKWNPDALSWIIFGAGIIGLIVLIYPTAAQWVTSYNQSHILRDYTTVVATKDKDSSSLLAAARSYNETLNSSAVLAANTQVPQGTAPLSHSEFDYHSMLRTSEHGMMARLRYLETDVDLPIYHGTSDDTLLRGAGHLEGTHLPIGGVNTHSVITAHRGLADATMFTHLDRASVGDVFSIEVLGQALAYRVTEIRVVAPDQKENLRVVAGSDLVTLVTCTPLGINSHRILVTGERVTPTPAEVTASVGAPSSLPGVPWWLAVLGGGLFVCGLYLTRAGHQDARRRSTPAMP